ncbi:hypothetical protein SteCoe_13506 [Stentor coeruleus]|uniref:B box-type domain-containing protein n=1 Tax=Stentor coeruleus TaxID=5963 RepID=A0A1R2C845_9CILI|nr:hypothetical protein SteCoe_13506 [Stentor coeruleus]
MQEKTSMCEECSSTTAAVFCQDCEQDLCDNCNELLHRGGKRKDHVRVLKCEDILETVKSLEKNSNKQDSFENLNILEKDALCQNSNQNSVRFFWDLLNVNLNLNQVKETASIINTNYSPDAKMYVYGKDVKQIQEFLAQYNFEARFNSHLGDLATLINDVPQEYDNYIKTIIITSRPFLIKQHLIRSLQTNQLSKLFFIPDIKDMYEIPSDEIMYSSSNARWSRASENKDLYKLTRRKAAASESSLELSMISYLKDLAYEGKIMHEINELIENLTRWMKISKKNAHELVNAGCKLGKLLQQSKKIGNIEMTIISLKIEKLDQENLLWVLRSLKNDEMISTEKAIQSRIKEAFDFKVPQNTWSNFIEYSLKPQRLHHKKSFSDSQSFSFFSQNDKKKTRNFSFFSKKVKDYVSGVEIFVIYPINEEWISYDQYIKSGDVFKIKQTRDWDLFIKFFESMFDTESPEEKAISGGRYGCAQYLKAFAEYPLKNSTLGKLSYMIQLAIDEDLLRYHKTLLVWVPSFDKKGRNDKLQLFSAKKSVIEALSQCPDGISLAQLPTIIKEKLPFDLDLSKLGFAKLKDLILDIPDIELISKGKNHPFVRLVKLNPPSLKNLYAFIHQIIDENDQSLPMNILEIEILEKFGFNFRWSWFKARSLEDLLKHSQEFIVNERNEVRKMYSAEKFHSYNSSTTSDAHSNYLNSEFQSEDIMCKLGLDKLEEIAEMQTKYIQRLLDEDEHLGNDDLD